MYNHNKIHHSVEISNELKIEEKDAEKQQWTQYEIHSHNNATKQNFPTKKKNVTLFCLIAKFPAQPRNPAVSRHCLRYWPVTTQLTRMPSRHHKFTMYSKRRHIPYWCLYLDVITDTQEP